MPVKDGEFSGFGAPVNGTLVTKDAHDGLYVSCFGLYIGTERMMQPETCFSGLIDDIRIYNRAVSP
jgi:hypothetical protein